MDSLSSSLAGLSIRTEKKYGSKSDQGPKLTPYQGKNKCFGEFKCQKCHKFWASPHSWANCYQECKGCSSKVYPFKQTKLEHSGEERKTLKPHPMELCQKCQQFGRACWKSRARF
ncbi:unnamed protein product [Meganyctiphanes norvegica]|uniref:3CxxC-type domain-containing protein n=1 Tax=Meganyctiphanes norvegica TaxID=48144 RepID=A0AAV2Q5X0_MEGNR